MGIYDREYYKSESRGSPMVLLQTVPVCKVLVGINVLIFLLYHGKAFEEAALVAGPVQCFGRWEVWRLLTAAFLHTDPIHLLFNMVGLYIFGRAVEGRIGSREFLVFYLTAAILASLIQCLFFLTVRPGSMMGASGAVLALAAIFVVMNPEAKLTLWFIIPVSAWHALAIMAFLDVVMTFSPKSDVATVAHLSGMGFGLAYAKLDWRLTSLWPTRWPGTRNRQPKLKVIYSTDSESYEPSSSERKRPRERRGGRGAANRQRSKPLLTVREDELDEKLDEVLAKIAREGRESLSEEENRILTLASQRAQARRNSRWRPPGFRGKKDRPSS